ncbi:hypothetical protein GJ496_010463 [Pomphorhynchus laevis]|nr:hypothetical protein GJ496_010463 [Pomphorhynchus laevis]
MEIILIEYQPPQICVNMLFQSVLHLHCFNCMIHALMDFVDNEFPNIDASPYPSYNLAKVICVKQSPSKAYSSLGQYKLIYIKISDTCNACPCLVSQPITSSKRTCFSCKSCQLRICHLNCRCEPCTCSLCKTCPSCALCLRCTQVCLTCRFQCYRCMQAYCSACIKHRYNQRSDNLAFDDNEINDQSKYLWHPLSIQKEVTPIDDTGINDMISKGNAIALFPNQLKSQISQIQASAPSCCPPSCKLNYGNE